MLSRSDGDEDHASVFLQKSQNPGSRPSMNQHVQPKNSQCFDVLLFTYIGRHGDYHYSSCTVLATENLKRDESLAEFEKICFFFQTELLSLLEHN